MGLGRRARRGGRRAFTDTLASLAPGSSLGWCSSGGRGVAACVAPGLGCTPKKWQHRGPVSRASKARRATASLATEGHRLAPRLCGPAAPMAPVCLWPGRPRPPGRTGRAPDEAQSAWQPWEPGCASPPLTVVKLASGPVRVARRAQAGSGDPHLPSGYSCDQSAGRRAACMPRAVAACSYCVVNVEDPEQARSPRLPHPRGCQLSVLQSGPVWQGACTEGPGRPRGAPHPAVPRRLAGCSWLTIMATERATRRGLSTRGAPFRRAVPEALPGLLLADDRGLRACHLERPGLP